MKATIIILAYIIVGVMAGLFFFRKMYADIYGDNLKKVHLWQVAVLFLGWPLFLLVVALLRQYIVQCYYVSSGYVARDGNGELHYFPDKPTKSENSSRWEGDNAVLLPEGLFAWVTWSDDEPKESEMKVNLNKMDNIRFNKSSEK